MERRDEYHQILESYKQESLTLQKKHNFYFYLRLFSFLILLALIILLFQYHFLAGIASVYIGISLFYLIVKAHLKITKRKNIVNKIIELNENEISGLSYEYDMFHMGEQFQNRNHPYIDDLDIFGNKSLFQYSCRSNTSFGISQLSELYIQGLKNVDTASHHDALDELEDNVKFRQELYAFTALNEDIKSFDHRFIKWISQDSKITFKYIFYFIIPLITGGLAYLCYLYLPELSMLLAFIPAGFFAIRHSKVITKIQSDATKHTKTLKSLADSVELIENESFKSTLLIDEQKRLLTTDASASKRIKRLAYCLNQLDLRNSFFGIMVNLMFPWDYYWSHAIQKWKNENKNQAESWFDTIGWMESRSSLATMGYNNPEWSYPIISHKKEIHASEIGHPLIPISKRVTNDFHSPTASHIKIVTGSNMGGKSTFLRTIGMNIVLTNAGAKVCAKTMQLPILKLYTSMRTLDALDENTSSFYAELKRIKMVLDQVKEKDNIYFLMDEILKGTNSNDRHTGAKALIKQLIKHEGAGLISTHDMALGELEAVHVDHIENVCFEVEVVDDQLVFDYKLKSGVSQSFNATQLMKNIGIDI